MNCDQLCWMAAVELAAAVREKRDCVPNPDEAVKTARVMDALAKSARDGVEVTV